MSKNENNNENNNGARGLFYGISIAVAAAILLGGISPQYAVHTAILGDIFLNLLKMVVVPLIMLSMIVGIVSLDSLRTLYAIGWKTGVYFLTTTVIAAMVGLVLVNFIQPGKNFGSSVTGAQDSSSMEVPGAGNTVNQWESEEYPDMQYTLTGEGLRTVVVPGIRQGEFSDKYLVALADQNVVGHIASVSDISVTVKSWVALSKSAVYIRSKTGAPVLFVENIVPQVKLKQKGKGLAFKLPIVGSQFAVPQNGILHTLKGLLLGHAASGREGMVPQNIFNAMVETNILPLIFFSIFMGYTLLMQGEVALPVIDALFVVNNAIMQFVHWIMYMAPIGIFGLIAGKIGEAGGFANLLPELIAVGKYSTTMLLGLFVHSAVVLPLLLWGIGGRNPFTFAKGMQPALLTAFSTASSSSTLPLTMDCVENNNGISSRTAIFVLPLGATLNMNGISLYLTVVSMFIAQVYGIALGPVEQCLVILVATLLAIGAASIPGATLMSTTVLLRTLQLPLVGITYIIAIDWLMERFGTVVNVWGDGVCAGIIEKYQFEKSEKTLETRLDSEELTLDSQVAAFK